tara:strand:+ start:4 stop:471 length:468 start_codon:yes stop_codon:yes gene_type:complete
MNKCFECEATEDLQEHHVVPKSRGGTKTVTLCYECHLKAHGRDGKGLNHHILTKEALAQAKRNGVKLGTHIPSVLEARYITGNKNLKRLFPHIQSAKKQGKTSRKQIADYLNENGILSPRGKTWNKNNISSTLARIKKSLLLGELTTHEREFTGG